MLEMDIYLHFGELLLIIIIIIIIIINIIIVIVIIVIEVNFPSVKVCVDRFMNSFYYVTRLWIREFFQL